MQDISNVASAGIQFANSTSGVKFCVSGKHNYNMCKINYERLD